MLISVMAEPDPVLLQELLRENYGWKIRYAYTITLRFGQGNLFPMAKTYILYQGILNWWEIRDSGCMEIGQGWR